MNEGFESIHILYEEAGITITITIMIMILKKKTDHFEISRQHCNDQSPEFLYTRIEGCVVKIPTQPSYTFTYIKPGGSFYRE